MTQGQTDARGKRRTMVTSQIFILLVVGMVIILLAFEIDNFLVLMIMRIKRSRSSNAGTFQGDINCSSLPAGLGRNGEFERKSEEI